MELYQDPINPSQSLQLITEVIAKTKDNIKRHSFGFMLWGWLIAIASALFYVLFNFTSTRFYFIPFPIAVVIGIFFTVRYYTGKRQGSETYVEYYLKRLWLVLGISFILVVAINVLQQSTPFTYTLLIGGIGTLVSGLVLKFRPLTIGGIVFLACTVLSVFVLDAFKPMLQAIAVILGYLVPGYLLKYSKD